MRTIRLGSYAIALPASRLLRIVIGVVLVLLGFVGFLPIVGFWMIPLGLAVLSIDLPVVRKWRRKFSVWLGRRTASRFPKLWKKFGGSPHTNAKTHDSRQPSSH